MAGYEFKQCFILVITGQNNCLKEVQNCLLKFLPIVSPEFVHMPIPTDEREQLAQPVLKYAQHLEVYKYSYLQS